MENKLISIIVPVYNVEEYLKQCLDSILEQTFSDYEVILVNDGSTDNSGLICQEYAEKDSHIRYFEKENGGLSDARNYGIEQAQGEYLTFVDSDDWVTETYIEELYSKLQYYNADISICNYFRFQDSNVTFYKHVFEPYEKEYDSKYLLEHYFEIEGGDFFLTTVWGKLYKKSLFEELRFAKGITSEDTALIYKVYALSYKIVYFHKDNYCYRQREGSISNSPTINSIEDSIRVTLERITLLSLKGYDTSSYLKHFQRLLELNEYNMRAVWGMSDTETYRKIKENLQFISSE